MTNKSLFDQKAYDFNSYDEERRALEVDEIQPPTCIDCQRLPYCKRVKIQRRICSFKRVKLSE